MRLRLAGRITIWLATIVIAVTAVVTIGCAERSTGIPAFAGIQRPAWSGLVKIGLIAPFSGYDADTAAQLLQGVRSAVGEWNGRGGIAGRGIELVTLDNWNARATTVARARELVVDPSVVGAIARFGGDGEEGASVLRQASLGTIAIGGPVSPDRRVGIWQMCVDAAAEGQAVAAYATGHAQAKRSVVIAADGEGYQTAARAFQQALDTRLALPPSPVFRANGNVAQLAADVLGASPDFIYYSGRAESGALFGLEVRRRSDIPLLLGSDAAGQAWQALFSPDENVAYVNPCSTSAGSQAGDNAQEDPAPEKAENAILAYNAANNLLEAMAMAATSNNPDRLSVVRELAKSRSFDEQHIVLGALAVVK